MVVKKSFPRKFGHHVPHPQFFLPWGRHRDDNVHEQNNGAYEHEIREDEQFENDFHEDVNGNECFDANEHEINEDDECETDICENVNNRECFEENKYEDEINEGLSYDVYEDEEDEHGNENYENDVIMNENNYEVNKDENDNDEGEGYDGTDAIEDPPDVLDYGRDRDEEEVFWEDDMIDYCYSDFEPMYDDADIDIDYVDTYDI